MTWRQLEAWAKKNGFKIKMFSFDPAVYTAAIDMPEAARLHVQGIGEAAEDAAKRALCRAVARMLESAR